MLLFTLVTLESSCALQCCLKSPGKAATDHKGFLQPRSSCQPHNFTGNEVCFGHGSQACTLLCAVLTAGGHWLYSAGEVPCGVPMCDFSLASTKEEMVWVALMVPSSMFHQTPTDTRQISPKKVLR